jgi:hypothetical protein
MSEQDRLQGATFRWSLGKIRVMSLGVGAGLGIAMGVHFLFDAFSGRTPSINTPLQDAAAGLAIAAVAGCAVGVGVAAMLLIGIACSKTVITADGLYVQRGARRSQPCSRC